MFEKIKNYLIKIPEWALTLIGFVIVGVAILFAGAGIVATYVTKKALARVKAIMPDEWDAFVLSAFRKLVSMWEEV